MLQRQVPAAQHAEGISELDVCPAVVGDKVDGPLCPFQLQVVVTELLRGLSDVAKRLDDVRRLAMAFLIGDQVRAILPGFRSVPSK